MVMKVIRAGWAFAKVIRLLWKAMLMTDYHQQHGAGIAEYMYTGMSVSIYPMIMIMSEVHKAKQLHLTVHSTIDD